jgi:D-3-phosphoglycerate dehydrogenase
LKIVVADDLPASALDVLRAEAGWEVDARSGRKAAELATDLADADALLVRSATKVTAGLLAAAPRLRIVGRAGTGVDNVDIPAATRRGIVVANAPESNSVAAAEHTLGLAGLGRIGQEVAQRARAFGMRVVAHDPFIAKDIAQSLGVELMPLDAVCAAADYLSLHLPSTAETRHLFDDARFACCKPGIRIINTARGELVDEEALARAIGSGRVAAAGLDVFETEPPADWSLASLPQVIATPHIAASTEEAQELVGIDTAAPVRDFLLHGMVRNAVNFPSVHPDEMQRLQPWIRLADRLGLLVSQLGPARIEAIGVRYYGALVESRGVDVLAASAAAGVLRPILSGGISIVNARSAARDRGIDIIESRSSRARHFTSLLSVKLQTDAGDRWVEGTVFGRDRLRLVSVGGIDVDAPLGGTMVIIANDDQPGVIGEVGTILGRHGVNIANFALGRGEGGAIGVVNVDEEAGSPALTNAVDEIRRVPPIREASVVRLS